MNMFEIFVNIALKAIRKAALCEEASRETLERLDTIHGYLREVIYDNKYKGEPYYVITRGKKSNAIDSRQS